MQSRSGHVRIVRIQRVQVVHGGRDPATTRLDLVDSVFVTTDGTFMRFAFNILAVVWLIGLSAPSAWARPLDPDPHEPASLTLRDLDGVSRDLEDYRGRIVVLNFWATWCLPCREEMPIFIEIRQRYAARGVEIIAASTDEEDSRKAVDRFARRQKLSFPVWVGATTEDMRRLGLGDALPATAIIDADGNVAFRIRGTVTRDVLEERLDHLLGETPGSAPDRQIENFDAEHPHEHGADHAHEGEEAHDHGSIATEDASLVPS